MNMYMFFAGLTRFVNIPALLPTRCLLGASPEASGVPQPAARGLTPKGPRRRVPPGDAGEILEVVHIAAVATHEQNIVRWGHVFGCVWKIFGKVN